MEIFLFILQSFYQVLLLHVCLSQVFFELSNLSAKCIYHVIFLSEHAFNLIFLYLCVCDLSLLLLYFKHELLLLLLAAV